MKVYNQINASIIIKRVIHGGQEHDAYIPQIQLNDEESYNVMSKNSYILKESHNPILGCSACSGHGCKQCNNRGTIKGESKDLIDLANNLLLNEIDELKHSIRILAKYHGIEPIISTSITTL